MVKTKRLSHPVRRPTEGRPETEQVVCPVCGAMTEPKTIGGKAGWTCTSGGYSHYYHARYGHLEQWFTSGQGNGREPVIQAMNCAA